MLKKTILILGIFFLISPLLIGQVRKDSSLFIALKKMDSIVFIEGFNNCNLTELEKIIPEDFEFYHDVGGKSSKNKFLADMKMNICSNPDKKLIRNLVANSIEVYPLYIDGVLYGVIQNGVHEFWLKKPNKEMYKTGIAKFSTTWLLIDGKWLMKNVLSFDHKAIH